MYYWEFLFFFKRPWLVSAGVCLVCQEVSMRDCSRFQLKLITLKSEVTRARKTLSPTTLESQMCPTFAFVRTDLYKMTYHLPWLARLLFVERCIIHVLLSENICQPTFALFHPYFCFSSHHLVHNKDMLTYYDSFLKTAAIRCSCNVNFNRKVVCR